MTTKEYFTAKRMWAEGFTAREIGDAIGYTSAYIGQVASSHREDFPKRPRTVTEPEMRHFCALAESYGTAIAARKAGVTQRTINRWMAVLRAMDADMD